MAHLSDSKEQRIAEKLILEGLEAYIGIPSGSLKTKKIMLDNVVSVEIDGYSDEYKIMVEVFAVKYYDFEVVRIDLSEDNREMILNAQQRQKEGMKL